MFIHRIQLKINICSARYQFKQIYCCQNPLKIMAYLCSRDNEIAEAIDIPIHKLLVIHIQIKLHCISILCFGLETTAALRLASHANVSKQSNRCDLISIS